MILNHIKILCNNEEAVADYLINWIAQMIQYTALKTICATLISDEGSGKGTLNKLIQNMLGTPIPYPYGCDVTTSTRFYDGTANPNGSAMAIASAPYENTIFGPSVDYGEPVQSVSQYEQSLPFVNSHLHYQLPQDIISNPNGFYDWNTLSINPDYVHTSVYDTTVYTTTGNPNIKYLNAYILLQKDSFYVLSYKIYTSLDNSAPAARTFKFIDQLALQQIYPDYEKTALIAVSGNTSNFVFLGMKEVPDIYNHCQLRFKIYDPIKGILTELPINTQYYVSQNAGIQKFVFNNSNGWYLSSYDVGGSQTLIQGTPTYSYTFDNNYISRGYPGTKTELQMTPTGINLYFASFTTNFTTFNLFPLDPTNENSIVRSSSGYTINLVSINSTVSPSYTQLAATFNNGVDELLLLNLQGCTVELSM
jgi:hypothetical protein